MKPFFNKIVAVTGGSSGIGKAVVESFCEQGAKVAILGRDPIKLKKMMNEFEDKILIVQGDISKLSDLDTFYKKIMNVHGKIDILVVNAGVSRSKAIEKLMRL